MPVNLHPLYSFINLRMSVSLWVGACSAAFGNGEVVRDIADDDEQRQQLQGLGDRVRSGRAAHVSVAFILILLALAVVLLRSQGERGGRLVPRV